MIKHLFKILLIFFCQISFSQDISADWKEDFSRGMNYFDIVKKNENNLRKLLRNSDNLRGLNRNVVRYQDDYKKASKQYGRWKNYWKNRTDIYGNYINPIIGYKSHLNFRQNSNITTDKEWEYLGPKNVPISQYKGYPGMGRVNDIEFDPMNENIIWVASATGGIWKSEDYGKNWTPKTEDLAVLGMSDIYINGNEIFITTGDSDGYYIPSTGVFKSSDGGNTWENIFILEESKRIYLSKILVDKRNSDKIILGNSVSAIITNDGFISYQGMSDFEYIGIKSITYSNDNNDEIYAGSHKEGTFLKSIDGGITWTKYKFPDYDGSTIVRTHPLNNNHIFCAVENSYGNEIAVYKSTDRGNTWGIISKIYGVSTQFGYNFAFEISPTDENVMLIGAVNGWRTKDGGANWELYLNGYPDSEEGGVYVHCDHHDLEFNPHTGKLYSGNDGGVFRGDLTQDQNWEDLSKNLHITQYYNFDVTKNKVILGGAQDNDFTTTNISENETWKGVGGPIDGIATVIDPYDDDIAYGGGQYGYIVKTTNNWITRRNIYSLYYYTDFVWPLVMDPRNNKVLYAGGKYLYKSGDKANTWTALGNYQNSINSICISPINSDYIYFSRGDNYIYYSKDGGSTWKERKVGDDIIITGIALSDSNLDKIFVTCGGYIENKKVFVSDDGGETWENISINLPNVPINCVVFQTAGDEDIYIGTDYGVYYKNNLMDEWEKYGKLLPSVIVNDIKIHYKTQKIIVATYGRGIWEVEWNYGEEILDSSNPDNLDAINKNIVVFSSVIGSDRQMKMVSKEDVTVTSMKIYNLIGGIVYSKNNVFLPSKNIITLSLNTIYSSGIYIVQLKLSNGKVINKKIIVK